MEKMIPDVKLTYRKPNMQLTDGNNSKRIKWNSNTKVKSLQLLLRMRLLKRLPRCRMIK
jgi:hypothetical protein